MTTNNTMNQLPKFDVAVIGGGLAGLTAAIYAARAGRSVIVFEKGPHVGGRATTQNVEGFHFNQGPHALYRGGEAVKLLRDLGIEVAGAQASYDGSWVMHGTQRYPMPGSPAAIAISKLFSGGAKVEALALFGRLMFGYRTQIWNETPLREWLETQISHVEVRAYFEGLLRLSTYCDNTHDASAGAALEQLIMGRGGVDYLDGGWQSLVDRLRDAAQAAGAQIETRSPVFAIRCGDDAAQIQLANGMEWDTGVVITTTSPTVTARLVNAGDVPSLARWAAEAEPIYAACLDVALRRLPLSEHQFAIGLDRPLYYSVHTRSAKLAPDGAVVIQLAKYLQSGNDQKAPEIEHELEKVMDDLQPGWRDELVTKRFLPRMLVSNAVVTAKQGGKEGRPGPEVPELSRLFVAGDWVGPEGMLADASMASARAAVRLAELRLAEPKSANENFSRETAAVR